MHAVMIPVWRLAVVAQCAVWIITFVCTTDFPEPGVYKFSDAIHGQIHNPPDMLSWAYSVYI